MAVKKIEKVRKNFTISANGIELLELLKINSFPGLSYSQIVDLSILYHADPKK